MLHHVCAYSPSFYWLLTLSWWEEESLLFVPLLCTFVSLAYKQYLLNGPLPFRWPSAPRSSHALDRAAPPRDAHNRGTLEEAGWGRCGDRKLWYHRYPANRKKATSRRTLTLLTPTYRFLRSCALVALGLVLFTGLYDPALASFFLCAYWRRFARLGRAVSRF